MAVSLSVRKDGALVIPRAVLERAGMAGLPRVWVQLAAGGLILRPQPLEAGPEGSRSLHDEEEMDDAAKGYKF